MRKKYRDTFNERQTQKSLRNGSHLMISSDNDVANDFTILKKPDGTQAYDPNFLRCGVEVYRQYQRKLWDPDCDASTLEEWHSHVYGEVGIFLIDMRGNRINGKGEQKSTNPLVSVNQWKALEEFFTIHSLKVIFICSEIPFVGDPPETIKKNAEKLSFLKDHWPNNDKELLRLLDLAFNWKASVPDRDVVFLAGDIHCGVTSVIKDKKTGLTINQLVATLVTNHVCNYYPNLEGNVNDRYSYTHQPLGKTWRNFAEVNIRLTKVHVVSRLVPITTDKYKNVDWYSSDDDEDAVAEK